MGVIVSPDIYFAKKRVLGKKGDYLLMEKKSKRFSYAFVRQPSSLTGRG
jgi:hypothetical protein